MQQALVAFALALVCFGSVPSVAGEEALIGRYRGCIESGDAMTPVDTEFEAGKNGLVGRYRFVDEDGSITPGRLDADGSDDRGRLAFVWRDKYGKGRAWFEPEADGSGFNGSWTADDGDEAHIWWGRKAFSTVLEKIDCGERSDS